MEKQEAIEKLREFCKLRAFCELYPDACQKDKCEIYMAIEALSEPSRQGQRDGNLISRTQAIDAIEKMNIPEDMCVFEILSHIEVEIATLPPAQPSDEYERGWKEGREALEKEIWEDGRDRLD